MSILEPPEGDADGLTGAGLLPRTEPVSWGAGVAPDDIAEASVSYIPMDVLAALRWRLTYSWGRQA